MDENQTVEVKSVVTDVVSKSELQATYTTLLQQKSQELASVKQQIAQLRKAEEQLTERAFKLSGAITMLTELSQSK